MVIVPFLGRLVSWRLLWSVSFDFNGSWLIGFRLFLVPIFVFQAAFRGSNFNRTICS